MIDPSDREPPEHFYEGPAMIDPIARLEELIGKATPGEWTLRLIDEGLAAGCYAIDIPANKWSEMSTWYIGPENAALAIALRNAAPALLAVARAARDLSRGGYTDPKAAKRLDAALQRLGQPEGEG